MDEKQVEVKGVREIDKPFTHCNRPMRKVIVQAMVPDLKNGGKKLGKQFRYVCVNGDHQQDGEVVDG